MYLIFRHLFSWGCCLAFISPHCSFANRSFVTSPTLSIKKIICPNICRAETTYKIVFEATDGVVSVSRGTIRNDTIFDISPENYLFKIAVLGVNNQQIEETIDLPICDPVLPIAPIGANQQICEGSPLPPLSVFTVEPTATVDWFDQPVAGRKLAINNPVFQTADAGVFYAESRFVVSGCVSLSRTPIALRVQRVLCPTVFAKKIRAN